MFRFLILAGYFELMMHLLRTGKLTQYINSHYTYLVILSMILSLVLAIVQLITWAKGDKGETLWQQACYCQQNHLTTKTQRFSALILLMIPLMVGFLFPAANLDASIVKAKGFHFPVSKETTSDGDISVQYLKPDTSIYFSESEYRSKMKKELAVYKDTQLITVTEQNYLTIMELIYQYPNEFEGKKIQFNGFAFNETDKKNKTEDLFLFRFGVIHCIADSGVFGLKTVLPDDGTKTYADNTWLEVTGTISFQYYAPFEMEIPVVTATHAEKIDAPKNQYVYRDFSD